MKICLAVCEYNPLHNGHLHHIEKIKADLSPDYLIIIMSGSFTQRGEIAVLNKFTRARHAILAGADAVFELPTVFATSNAEMFAKGAVKLLKDLPGEKTLCFGAESGSAQDFLSAASVLSSESKEFKKLLKEQLDSGVSLAKAKCAALEKMDIGVDVELLKSPNNILGVEYTRAILEFKADISVYPIARVGSDFNDGELKKNYSSATAIRSAIAEGKRRGVKSNVPRFVYGDLPKTLPNADELIFYSLVMADKRFLKEVCDCTEGLENRIKSCLKSSTTLEQLKKKIITKRYTRTRVNRICLQAMLGITEDFIKKCLKSQLYLNVLAVRSGCEKLLSMIKTSCPTPLITRKTDADGLKNTAAECFKKDAEANKIYSLLSGEDTNEYLMLKV